MASRPDQITSDAEALAYIASYEDLISYFGTDTTGAIKHYEDFGKTEGRTITFDASQYLLNYTDLTNFFSSANGYTTSESITIGAIRHFIDYGHEEGRTDAKITTISTTSTSTDTSPDLSTNSNPSSLLSNILNTGDLIEVIKSYINIINNNEYTLQISGGNIDISYNSNEYIFSLEQLKFTGKFLQQKILLKLILN